MSFREFLKAVLLGILEGVTEWLPVSSTGHMILFDAFLPLAVSEGFRTLFLVVIQFFAVLAVLTVYRKKLFPFFRKDGAEEKKAAKRIWKAVFFASLPAALLGFLLDDLIDRYLFSPFVVAAALIVYGVVFLLIDRPRAKPSEPPKTPDRLSPASAIGVGFFQSLSLIPGTSRSGATILGGIALGMDRRSAAEFSFFLALPVMLGASGLKIAKYLLSGAGASGEEILLLLVGSVVAYLTSLIVIRALVNFVGRHSFRPFGVYRILLGVVVLIFFFASR